MRFLNLCLLCQLRPEMFYFWVDSNDIYPHFTWFYCYLVYSILGLIIQKWQTCQLKHFLILTHNLPVSVNNLWFLFICFRQCFYVVLALSHCIEPFDLNSQKSTFLYLPNAEIKGVYTLTCFISGSILVLQKQSHRFLPQCNFFHFISAFCRKKYNHASSEKMYFYCLTDNQTFT